MERRRRPSRLRGGMSLPSDQADVAQKATAALERIGQAFRVLLQREAQRRGLTPTQLQLLLRLVQDPPARCRPGALARELDVTPASLSASIGALERKGLVQRARSESDLRGFTLATTRSGSRLARELEGVAGPVERAIRALDPAAQTALMRSCFELIAELQRREVVTVARMCITCEHFRPRVRSGPQPHHCALLDAPLAEDELRVDCPEHERAA